MKKIKRYSEPIIFKNSDFQTIQIKLFFPFRKNEEDIAKACLLPHMLHYMNNKYPTEKEFNLEKERLFILNCGCSYDYILDEGYFLFRFMIPDTYSIKEDMLEEQFKFFYNMIYNPKAIDNHFDSKELTREVKNLRVDIEKAMNDPGTYAIVKVKEIIDDGGYLTTNIINHQDQIDLVNENNLYEYYLKHIYNNHPFVYVFGNVDEDRIKELCHKYLYRTPIEEKEFEVLDTHYLPIRDTVNRINEKSEFRNSVYVSCYKVKDMCDDDRMLLEVVQRLLSSQSTRLLSKALRDESDLVYSVSSNISTKFGLLSISAYIHKDTVETVKVKIKEVLNSLKDVDMVQEGLDNIKERVRVSLLRQLDNKTSLFADKVLEQTKIDYTYRENYELLLKVKAEDIKVFVDRLILDTEYFLEEGEHE